MTYQYRRVGTSVVPALRSPDRAYAAMDGSGRLRAVVAGSGRSWWAGRVGPKRSEPVIASVWGETRAVAVERLVRGRP